MENYKLYAYHNYTQNPNLNMFKMHTHDEFEIFCFISGKAKYFIEGTEYFLNPYDILLMKKSESHSLQLINKSPYERIVIQFDENALLCDNVKEIAAFFNSLPLGTGNLFPYKLSKNKYWMYYLEQIQKSDDKATKKLYLTVLLKEMYTVYPYIEHTSNVTHTYPLVTSIIEYIHMNLTNDICLDSICSHHQISKSYANRQFKKITGSSIWGYIKRKRLILAKQLLNNGSPPTAVYLKCGFNDYCSFYKAYKDMYEHSPKEDMLKK